ncbi:hypothetical protein [Phormidium tenue]|uniref:Uncharacterized protein n=1 Tax=Phormidium tenue NIES-30 TaxID=549789 RepID=A0A1U7J0P3_9CYAN|nr:hypothetical protein [Phormidium tenue]MBD2234244.1 hypothetical protein [Phormidium tenue FACHB-1052]OKH45178.1 hypothetical protein NIES30_20595 [Phormidium tenue NIES-30]
MKSAQGRVSSCSRCRFYAPEGRRGGQCSQLGVPVESRWKPCPLAVPVFAPPLVPIKSLDLLPQPLELGFPTVFREAARLEAALEAPAVTGHLAEAIQPIPAQVCR